MPKNKNALKKRPGENPAQALRRQIVNARYEGFTVGKSLAFQQMLDIVEITLHEDFKFGSDRIKKFQEKVESNFQEMLDISHEDTDDRVYTTTVLDRRLKDACGEYFVPYAERYEYSLDPDFFEKEAH